MRLIGGIVFWGALVASLYLKALGLNDRPDRDGSVWKFVTMIVLWLLFPIGGGILAGLLVSDLGWSDVALLASVGVMVLIPWLLAIRLQMAWTDSGSQERP